MPTMGDPTRQRVWTGERFALESVAVPRRSGGVKHKDMLVHPGAVALVPILDDGRVILIENQRFAVEERLWEIPAGTLEPGEDPAACAARAAFLCPAFISLPNTSSAGGVCAGGLLSFGSATPKRDTHGPGRSVCPAPPSVPGPTRRRRGAATSTSRATGAAAAAATTAGR